MSAVAARHALLDGLFEAIDTMDAKRFAGFLTVDAQFRFGSAPAVVGRDAIRSAVDEFFATIAALSHSVKTVVSDGSTIICEGEVTYTRHDGTSITLPFADVFEMADEMIANYKIYMDINPLYAA